MDKLRAYSILTIIFLCVMYFIRLFVLPSCSEGQIANFRKKTSSSFNYYKRMTNDNYARKSSATYRVAIYVVVEFCDCFRRYLEAIRQYFQSRTQGHFSESTMVSFSRFICITNLSDHRMVRVTTGWFELRPSYIQCSYLTREVVSNLARSLSISTFSDRYFMKLNKDFF